MKTCENCGIEIGTKDGDNLCGECEAIEMRCSSDRERNIAWRKQRNKQNRRAKEAAMLSLGLVKVRGAMGGVYWE